MGRARFAAVIGLEVPVGSDTVVAADTDALAAVAALLTADPERATIVRASTPAT